MSEKLDICKEFLSWIKYHITSLSSDIVFQENGGKIFYAVDFSEIYSFVNYKPNQPSNANNPYCLRFGSIDPNIINDYYIALNHLFITFPDKLYVLPPHAHEMWRYIINQKTRCEKLRRDLKDLHKTLNIIDPQYLATLRSITNPSHLSTEQCKTLLEFIKGDFKNLCFEISNFVDKYKHGVCLNRLKDLLTGSKISCYIDNIFSSLQLIPNEVSVPSNIEGLNILELLSKEKEVKKNRLAVLSDILTLLFLRNVNKCIESKNTKLLLITRDRFIHTAAENPLYQKWFDWDSVVNHVRNIEVFYFKIILDSFSSNKEKLDWLEKTGKLLADMQKSIESIVDRSNDLVISGEKILNEIINTWHEYINLRISVSTPIKNLLNSLFRNEDTQEKVPKEFENHESEYKLIKKLWSFANTEEFQKTAREGIEETWNEMCIEEMRILFLGLLGRQKTDEFINYFLGASSDFSIEEFNNQLAIEELCNIINNDDYGLSLEIDNNISGIDWLNNLLKITDFYDKLFVKKPNYKFSENINELVGITMSYRNKNFLELGDKEQNDIKRLNRLLLEEIYPSKTPPKIKHKNQVIPVLCCPKYGLQFSLHFVSVKFQKHLEKLLQVSTKDYNMSELIKECFPDAVESVKENKAEGFLFLAFVFGILNMWDDAFHLATLSLSISKAKTKCVSPSLENEINYFLAIAKRKDTEHSKNKDINNKINSYEEAYHYINNAINNDQKETRYFEELVTILSSYHNTIRIASQHTSEVRTSKVLPNEDESIELFKKALTIAKNDSISKIHWLYNLAYMLLVKNPPSLKEEEAADSYINEIKQEIDTIQKEKDKFWALIHISAILAFFNAITGRRKKDITMIEGSLDELEKILNKHDIEPFDKENYIYQCSLMKKWMSEIKTTDSS